MELGQHTKRISDKLQQLLKRYASVCNENERLRNELSEIKTLNGEKEELIKLLTLRIEVLKAAKGAMTDEEKESFEKKINAYLKEIDKCISLLND